MSDEQEPILDAYLHGGVSADERAAFERQTEGDDRLRAEVERQRALDAALGRLFVPPSADQMLARLHAPPAQNGSVGAKLTRSSARPAAQPPQRAVRAWWWRGLAAAAAIALLAVGVRWFVVTRPSEPPGPVIAASSTRPLAEVYRRQVADGFKPEWVCKNDQEFASTYWWILGQGMIVANLPEGVEALGVDYGRAISPKTTLLLARVRGTEVLVFADRLEDDPGQPPPDGGLNQFYRVVGGLVLYELSPLDRAYLLESFEQVDVPDEWKKSAPYPGMPR